MTDKPGWVVPGAPVVLYNRGGASTPRNVKRTKITKINQASFDVDDGSMVRFKLSSYRNGSFSVGQGGSWGWTRVCVPADSREARYELAEARKRKLTSDARNACEKWIREPSAANRRAAIKALEAVED